MLLHDFHCGQARTQLCTSTIGLSSSSKKGTKYPLANFISYNSLSSSHQAFFNTISSIVKLTTYTQAVHDPKWREAMNHELTALANQKT